MRIAGRWSTRILLASALGLAVAACEGPKPGSGDTGSSGRASLTIDPSSITRAWTGDLDGMVERRIVRVLVVPSKTLYFQDRGTQRGTSYDMFQVVERELNARLAKDKRWRGKPRVKFFFVPVHRDQILQYLVEGKGDIAAANLTITPARQQLVDFAAPNIRGVREVLLTGPASPQIATVEHLAGKEVFVRRSSSYFESLAALSRRLAAAGRPPVRLKEAPEQLEDEDLIEMLNAGLVSALVVDKHKADLWAQVFPRVKVRDDIVLREGGEVAWAMRKASPQLKAFLDQMATATGRIATERAVILARYLKSLDYVKDAQSEAERRKFAALTEHFRKYGERYDMDWLLMAAQGYQESGLDQNKRSPMGAIGVMQVMPATGRELKVGDITKAEPNIHAGVKYMRFVVDRYFDKEPMTPLDKVLFAFAAYNAGPARVAQLRKEAARRGLDPNVWFGNVELVAAEKVGQQPVTYVANIYKYYVAYKLALETHQERDERRRELQAGTK